MSKTSKPKNPKTMRQRLGAKQALKLGLPQVCPLLITDEKTGEQRCKQTKKKLSSSLLCELDAETNVDYRLCDTFSTWFWEEEKKPETDNQNNPNQES